MATLADALKAAHRRGEIVQTRTWWSEFGPAPTCPDPCPSCIINYLDQSQVSDECPNGKLTHVCVAGRMLPVGECTPGTDGDGRWYQPILFQGQPVSQVPYPVCYGGNVMTDANSMQGTIPTVSGGIPTAIMQVNGIAVACFDPAVTPPGSVDPIDTAPQCTVGSTVISHEPVVGGSNQNSRRAFCAPPPPYGTGDPNPAGSIPGTQFVYNVNNPLPHTIVAPPAVGGFTAYSTVWVGPIEVECGSPLLQVTVDHAAGFGDFSNSQLGWGLVDSVGNPIGIQGAPYDTTTPAHATDECQVVTTYAPFTGGPQLSQFITLQPVTPGTTYWLMGRGFVGPINSVTVECF